MDLTNRFSDQRREQSANGRYISYVCAPHQESYGNAAGSKDFGGPIGMLRGNIGPCAHTIQHVLPARTFLVISESLPNHSLAKKDGL